VLSNMNEIKPGVRLPKFSIKNKIPSLLKKIMIVLFIIIYLFGMYAIWDSRARYYGPVSDHFDGTKFYYKGSSHSFSDMVKWLREMKTVKWPDWVDDPFWPKPVEKVADRELRVTYINHATTLIQIDGINILTDPIWSERAGPFSWLGARRVRNPGVKMEDLPKIDVILISHDHNDHLDLRTLRKLNEKHHPKILVGLGVSSVLGSIHSDEIVELDWWQNDVLDKSNLKFTFVPAMHNSGRSLFGSNRTLWGGFVIEGKGGNVYFSGDTGYADFFKEIQKRFGSFRLTVLPLGSYEKRWYMKNQHMNPEDSVKVHKMLNSKQSVGIHYSTFLEHPEQTIDAHEKDLKEALEKYSIPQLDFWILKFGEGRDVK